MTRLVPALTGCLPRMTAGEKRFARLLESHLEDDYLCWFETPVGVRHRYTDFIVLHPGRGLLLLEVKDWSLDTIQCADRTSFTLLGPNGHKRVAHPLEQVRQCSYRLVRDLERDPGLRHADGPHAGKLACPYAFGVVMAGITRAQLQASGLDQVLPPHLVICRDEMSSTVDVEAFQTRLWDMFPVRFRTPLSLPRIERVRWHLFPEIRIEAAGQPGQATLFDAGQEDPVESRHPYGASSRALPRGAFRAPGTER